MPLAEHDDNDYSKVHANFVSIHVPLAEHDSGTWKIVKLTHVSIHVPLAEHDLLYLHLLHI